MGDRMDRRAFWRRALRGVLPGDERAPASASTPGVPLAGPIRPPGAVAEATFLERCPPGCRLCVDACPEFVIIPSLERHQPGGGDGRPYLLPDQGPCTLCGLCMPACPTGALQPTPPGAVRLGLAEVDAPACIRTAGEACSACVGACPVPTAAFQDDGRAPPEVLAAGCTGCGLCLPACPSAAISHQAPAPAG